MMATVDVSLFGGCVAVGNSQKVEFQPSVFLQCYLRGMGRGGVGRGSFSLVSLMLLHILDESLSVAVL